MRTIAALYAMRTRPTSLPPSASTFASSSSCLRVICCEWATCCARLMRDRLRAGRFRPTSARAARPRAARPHRSCPSHLRSDGSTRNAVVGVASATARGAAFNASATGTVKAAPRIIDPSAAGMDGFILRSPQIVCFVGLPKPAPSSNSCDYCSRTERNLTRLYGVTNPVRSGTSGLFAVSKRASALLLGLRVKLLPQHDLFNAVRSPHEGFVPTARAVFLNII